MIGLSQVRPEGRPLLWRLLQDYLRELSRWYDISPDSEGNYPYRYFDAYFSEPDRVALLILECDIPVGFALLNSHSCIDEAPDHVLAEFTVLPAYRGRGIATQAVQRILAEYGGRWEIKYSERNTAASRLWNRIARKYNPRRHNLGNGEIVLAFSAKRDGKF